MRQGSLEIIRVEGIHGSNPVTVRKMGTVSGFIVRCENEKTVYIAGDTVFYDGVVRNIETYRPEVIMVNACGATTPAGRLIMNPEEAEQVCLCVPDALVTATHLDSVNHATVTRRDVIKFKEEKSLKQLLIPEDGECIRL